MTNKQFWNSVTMNAKEFKGRYYQDGEFWAKYGETIHNRLLNEKNISKYDNMTKSELNQLSIQISSKIMDDHPKTWKEEIKKDVYYNEVITELKKR